MGDVLIRGLSDVAIARIDDAAALSRHECLRTRFETLSSRLAASWGYPRGGQGGVLFAHFAGISEPLIGRVCLDVNVETRSGGSDRSNTSCIGADG
jgi:hypothetical protein